MQNEDQEYTISREHPRVRFESFIGVQIPEWPHLEARSIDVSRGGIALHLPNPVVVGDRIFFSMVMPDGEHRTIEAEVRYVLSPDSDGHCQAGLRWLNLTPTEQSALEALVDELGPRAA